MIQLWKKIEEDERLELLSNENKRRKMMQLRRDVEDMCKERRQRRAAEVQQQIRMLEEERKEEVKRYVLWLHNSLFCGLTRDFLFVGGRLSRRSG